VLQDVVAERVLDDLVLPEVVERLREVRRKLIDAGPPPAKRKAPPERGFSKSSTKRQ